MAVVSGPYGDNALAYLENGWHPLPLPAGAKTPPPGGFTGAGGAVPTRGVIEAWVKTRPEGNIALRLPEGVIGIDIDAYGDKPGADTITAAIKAYGELPRTWHCTTLIGV